MKEEIRMIPWTNGQYGVSNLGNVYYFYNSIGNRLKTPRKKKLHIKNSGHFDVILRINGEKKHFGVHRLVASVFIPNPDNLPQVNHKDENKLNNCVENLEWCTAAYNSVYTNSKSHRGKRLVQLSISGEIIKTFSSQKDAAHYFECSTGFISLIINGKKQNKFNLHYI